MKYSTYCTTMWHPGWMEKYSAPPGVILANILFNVCFLAIGKIIIKEIW